MWAPGSCKDHVALPLQPQLQTHKPLWRRALDRTLIFTEIDVPSPLTWLSNHLREQQGRQHPHAPSFSHPLTPAHVEFSWDGNILKHIYTIKLNRPKQLTGPNHMWCEGGREARAAITLPPSGCLSHQGPSCSFQVEGDTKNTTVINGDRSKHVHKCSSANWHPICQFAAEQEIQKINL